MGSHSKSNLVDGSNNTGLLLPRPKMFPELIGLRGIDRGYSIHFSGPRRYLKGHFHFEVPQITPLFRESAKKNVFSDSECIFSVTVSQVLTRQATRWQQKVPLKTHKMVSGRITKHNKWKAF